MPASPKDLAAMAGCGNSKYRRPLPTEDHQLTYARLRKEMGYASGLYQVRCKTCGTQFEGDKRAFTCRPCADRMLGLTPSAPRATGDTGQYNITSEDELANLPPQDTPFLNRLLAEGRAKQRLIADIYNEIWVGLSIHDKNSRNRAYDVARKIVELVEDRDA